MQHIEQPASSVLRTQGGAATAPVRCSNRGPGHGLRALSIAALFAATAAPASANDACTVLLCLSSGNWRSIPMCVPPVHRVLRDLALGRPFPTCAMSGNGNDATHAWAQAPAFCPPQYTLQYQGESGPLYECEFVGAVTVLINGSMFSRTWWKLGGDSVTEFSPAAKAQLGTWNTRFDDDYAARVPPPAPAPPPPPESS